MEMFDIIKSRRSIRKFTAEPVPDDAIEKIVQAGMWAPSGLNNQPWKFAVIKDTVLKTELAALTHYSKIILGANAIIAVFLDHSLMYDRTKDCQAIGACVQNMLLTIHSMGLGAVWLGEILKNKDRFLDLTGAGSELELMAVVALGHPAEKAEKGSRKDIQQTIIIRK